MPEIQNFEREVDERAERDAMRGGRRTERGGKRPPELTEKQRREQERRKIEKAVREAPEVRIERVRQQADEAKKEADAGSAEVSARAEDIAQKVEAHGGSLIPEEAQELDITVTEAASEAEAQKAAVESTYEEFEPIPAPRTPSSEKGTEAVAPDAESIVDVVIEEGAEPWQNESGKTGVRVTKESREAVRAMVQETRDSRAAVAAAEQAMKKFDGVSLRGLTGADKMERATAQAALDAAKERYESARGEYVGDSATRMLKERMAAEDARGAAEVEREKGFVEGSLTKIYDAYKALGEAKLTSSKWEPTSRIGKMVKGIASVRTLASTALLGGGIALGAGTGGLGLLAARRIMSGVGASIGSYDLMRAAADSRASAFKDGDEVEMNVDDVVSRMESMEARARLEGTQLEGDPKYAALRREFRSRLSGEYQADLEGLGAGEYEGKAMQDLMKEADQDISEAAKKRVRNDRAMKGAALGIGVLAGSGELGKAVGKAAGWVGDTDMGRAVAGSDTVKGIGKMLKGAKEYLSGPAVARADSVESFTPGEESLPPKELPEGVIPAEAPAEALMSESAPVDAAPEAVAVETAVQTPEAIAPSADGSLVQSGDGYIKVFARQMEGDPAKFGYDPATHGEDVHKWAMKEANGIAHEQGLMDKRLGFDPKNPERITLNPDSTFVVSGEVAPVAEGLADAAGADKQIEEIAFERGSEVQAAPLTGEAAALAEEAKRAASEKFASADLSALEAVTDTPAPNSAEAISDAARASGAPAPDEVLPNPYRAAEVAVEAKTSAVIENGRFQEGGIKAFFKYGADGKVVGMGYEASAFDRFEVMRNGAEYEPAPGSIGEVSYSTGLDSAVMGANRLSIEMKIYRSLAEAGQQNAPEAKYLLKNIKYSALGLYKEAGPKFLKLEVFRTVDGWEKAARRG